MLIQFEFVRWKNLLSTGNQWTEIQLNRSKSTLIVGKNGAGKSTFLDALMYLLYSKPYRDVNKPQMINSIIGKGLLVEGQFKIGKKTFFVRRGESPGIFEVYVDGVQIPPLASKVEDQKIFVKNILKMSDKSFKQIVVLGSANYVPFMQLQTGDRRKIIEDLLDIQIFSTMNALLSKKVSLNKADILENDTQIRIIQSRIDMGRKHIEELKQNNEDLIATRLQKIQASEDQIAKVMQTTKELQDDVEMLAETVMHRDKLAGKLQKIREMDAKLQERSKKLKKDIAFFSENEDCPTCKQGIRHDFREHATAVRQTKLDEIDVALNRISDEYQALTERMIEIGKVHDQILRLNEEIYKNNNEITFQNKNITALQEEIEDLRRKTVLIDEDQTDLNQNLKELTRLNKMRERLVRSQSVIEVAGVLLKDSGIKAKIIKQYVPIMNKLINKYLAQMDFFSTFELDESFNEKIKSRHRDEFSYANFSEGEKARINFSLLMTWRAIAKLRNSAGTNLLVLDEIFDGSADEEAVDSIVKLLNEAENSNIFVISHNEKLADKFHSMITFEKVKNFSQIAER